MLARYRQHLKTLNWTILAFFVVLAIRLIFDDTSAFERDSDIAKLGRFLGSASVVWIPLFVLASVVSLVAEFMHEEDRSLSKLRVLTHPALYVLLITLFVLAVILS